MFTNILFGLALTVAVAGGILIFKNRAYLRRAN
jgi:hypothetical protein